jgi:Zn finger protein HypA/HybF involved in hydrogenase expression
MARKITKVVGTAKKGQVVSKATVTVRCVCCKTVKETDSHTQPLCDKCGSPMVAIGVRR